MAKPASSPRRKARSPAFRRKEPPRERGTPNPPANPPANPPTPAPDWHALLQVNGYDPYATAAPGEYFDPGAAEKAVAFIQECLTHVEGALSGKPFLLSAWEKPVVWNIFGWKRADGSRRYREVFIFIPRKNGKTPFAAGLALCIFFTDDEKGQQDFCAAAEKDQAALVYRWCKGMIQNEPELQSRCKIFAGVGQRSITRESDGSFLKVISADADTKHGGNSHLVIIDELHAQPNRDLVDVLATSMASKNRRQPLMVYITTSDFDRPSICNEKHDYASKVRDGIIKDSAFLPVIYEATLTDDWRAPATWRKANPNFGISVDEEYMARECKRAQEEPTYENTFKRLHLNIRTEQAVRWLQLEAWDACGVETVDEASLAGTPCYAGLDLSSTTDLTAFVLYFPAVRFVKAWFWVPADNAEKRERRDRVPYLTWSRQGLIELTPGDVVDYDYVRKRVLEVATQYSVQSIGYDPWNARQVSVKLKEDHGLPMVEFRQGFVSMNEPCKNIEKLVMGRELRHNNNPLLRWMASNVSCETDAAGNLKMSKAKSTEKIDGMVGLAMAVGLSLTPTGQSVYETKGMLVLGGDS